MGEQLELSAPRIGSTHHHPWWTNNWNCQRRRRKPVRPDPLIGIDSIFYIPYVASDIVAKIGWSHKNSRKNATLQRIDRTNKPWLRSILKTSQPIARRTPTQRGDENNGTDPVPPLTRPFPPRCVDAAPMFHSCSSPCTLNRIHPHHPAQLPTMNPQTPILLTSSHHHAHPPAATERLPALDSGRQSSHEGEL